MYWYLLIICVFSLVMFYPDEQLDKDSSTRQNVTIKTDTSRSDMLLQIKKVRKEIFEKIQQNCIYMSYESFQVEKIESRNGVSHGNKVAAGCRLKVLLKDDITLNILMEVDDSKPIDELGYRSTFWLSPEEFQKHFRI